MIARTCVPRPAALPARPAPRARHASGRPELAPTTPGRPALAPLRAFEDELKLEQRQADTPGVDSLLERDRRQIELNEDAFAEASPSKAAQAVQELEPQQPVAASSSSSKEEGPRRCREAIDLGLERFAARDYAAAAELFTLALELPGTGLMRLAGSVHERACPSVGEERAALYNLACAYAQMGKAPAALTCVGALLEGGWEDFDTLRTDSDLALLRGAELEALIAKHNSPLKKLPFLGKRGAEEAKPRAWTMPW